MAKRKYDFAGWVTKNNTKCVDGLTIMHDAFKECDGKQVPLVWNHDYKNPENVLGHVILQNHPTKGVYGYGYFNDTERAESAKEQIRHGDISSMSIGARKIKRQGTNVVHGLIYEVSLVLAGANPGALIDSVIQHSDDGTTMESGIIYTGNLIHSIEDIIEEVEPNPTDTTEEEMGVIKHTIEEVLESMNDEQLDAVAQLIEGVAEEYESEETEEDENEEEETDEVKQNAFNKATGPANKDEVLRHSFTEALDDAKKSNASSLKDVIKFHLEEDSLQHGINSVEMLFPVDAHSTNGNTPILYKDPNTGYGMILSGVTKSPFSKIKTLVADLTEEEARAKGYIKGTMKKEQFFSLIKRSTGPCTVYKKQKIDRDDLVDITDFDVVAFMNREMRAMLEEEVARALMVGDGRDVASPDKIDELCIRPIIKDHEFFCIHKAYTSAATFVEDVIRAMPEYRGSGAPTMYIDPTLLADVKLQKGADGKYLYGDIPSTASIASRLGMANIVETTFMSGKGAVVVNLRDYNLGATKGGQITNFDDFDIDFNQYKYLIETRLSGALTMPKSAIYFKMTAAGAAQNDAEGGVVYGERMPVEP